MSVCLTFYANLLLNHRVWTNMNFFFIPYMCVYFILFQVKLLQNQLMRKRMTKAMCNQRKTKYFQVAVEVRTFD